MRRLTSVDECWWVWLHRVYVSNRKEPSLTEELLTVVQLTQMTILELDGDNAVVYELACLHLMAASALLTRCPKPQEAQCKPFLLSSKQLKAHACGSAKRAVLQALQVFYEHFNDQLEKSSRFPVWSNLEWTDKARKARKEEQQKASFCELVVFAFTFLNEVSAWFRVRSVQVISNMASFSKGPWKSSIWSPLSIPLFPSAVAVSLEGSPVFKLDFILYSQATVAKLTKNNISSRPLLRFWSNNENKCEIKNISVAVKQSFDHRNA